MGRGSKVFSVLVVGDNPQELMDKYDASIKVERYVKYRYLDAKKLHNNSIKVLSEITKNPTKFNLTGFQCEVLNDRLKTLTEMSDFDYYKMITEGLYYDENGDALSDENPNGKWQTAKIGDNFSMPLLTKDGKEVRQARYDDIDWSTIHMNNTALYENIWQMIKCGKEPSNDYEKTLYENLKDNENYFSKFKTCDDYVIHNCAYWNYAYLDENGWVDVDDFKKDTEWVATYYDKFLSNLKGNPLITIYECTKGKD